MVNEDFKKFREVQKKHEGVYLGGENQELRINDDSYNNQDDTDKSVGASGRKQRG